jgi:hypothetical protein
MTTFHVLTFHDLRALVGDRYGRFDVPCPACGPLCRAASNRRRPVLRVWREEAEFISFCCARRGQRGFAKDCESPPTPAPRDRERAKARAAAAVQRQHADLVQNTARALAIWNDAQPICGTLAEQYLKRRGLVVPDECGRVLRFHPCCPFGNQRRLPSMVALMRNIQTDAPQAINRTALSRVTLASFSGTGLIWSAPLRRGGDVAVPNQGPPMARSQLSRKENLYDY